MLRKIQLDHSVWQTRNFGKMPTEDSILGIVEEIGELAHHLLKKKQKVRGTPEFHDMKMKDAIGDIIVFLMGFCTGMGWDIEDILIEVWSEVSKRDWIKDPEKGRS